MSTSDEALVIDAAEKYGFNIEFKTKTYFKLKDTPLKLISFIIMRVIS
ncbi:TPA: hypothetical protein ACTXXA_000005 [Legionella anisa]